MSKVKQLLLKHTKGEALNPVDYLDIGVSGIEDNIPCLPLRQVLLLPDTTLTEFKLNPGDLRENIVVSNVDIHNFSSGTVIKIGEVLIRLTYHCEPCVKINHLLPIKQIQHKRGYLGSFLNQGRICINDNIEIQEQQLEPIPYDIKDRIRWYLDQTSEKVSIKKLAYDVGLSRGYYRAIPNMMKSFEEKYLDKVFIPSRIARTKKYK